MPITGGDWLFAIRIASCGLKLDDEAVRVAVGLRLGRDLCEQHRCHCGSVVDACGLHSFQSINQFIRQQKAIGHLQVAIYSTR